MMNIRLHEIEIGSPDVSAATGFFKTILGLKSNLQQEGLTVFDAGVKGLDFNVSNHLSQGTAVLSFLIDDLSEIERRLKGEGISYEGPSASHLGMSCIQFRSPDGSLIKVNTPGAESPQWLQV